MQGTTDTAERGLNEAAEQRTAPAERATVDWGYECSAALRWANERAWLLGDIGLFTSAVYLHNYITVENVPLSITSASAITALPTVFALVLFLVAVVTALFLIPTVVFFAPISKGVKPIASLIPSDKASDKRLWLRFSLRWIAGSLVSGVLIWLLIYLLAMKLAIVPPWATYALGLAPALPVLAVLVFNHPQIPSIRRISGEFWVTAAAGGWFSTWC